ncbi:MAG: Zn-dependent exopeptidase M28 [Oscillospiraceae bacterium]|nr:Zn-dependent exopeptidase M28 [Oscillospiraceae bacterium]
MTARERIGNYPSRLREYTNFAVRGIKKVCEACGPRECGSEAEWKAQQMMVKDLETCCDSVVTEEFRTAPRAFLGWISICVVFGLLSALAFNFGYAIVSLVLLGLALLMVVLEFLFYKQAIDFMYRKKTSHNVVGVRKPAGETKRRIILCGHADSAYEWRFTYWGDKYFHTTKLLVLVIALCFGILFFGLVASVVGLAAGLGWAGRAAFADHPALTVIGYIFAGLMLPMMLGLLFKNNKRVVMGANDNLSGCFTSMAVAKLLGDQDLRLDNTELVVLCSGGEECGLRGAKAYVKDHDFSDAETVFLSLDTMRDYNDIGIYINDMTMTVKHDPRVCALMKKAANTAGFDIPYCSLFLGASDAAAASQAGLAAAAFAAMDPTPAAYYHTRLDTEKNLDPKTVEACLDIALEIVHQFDATGLEPFEGITVKAEKMG